MRLCPDNASRLCGWDGVWAERTDYSACKLLEQKTSIMEEAEMGEEHADLEISIIIYLIGKMSLSRKIARSVRLCQQNFDYQTELSCINSLLTPPGHLLSLLTLSLSLFIFAYFRSDFLIIV